MRETMGYDKNNEDREKNDYYATPPEEVKKHYAVRKIERNYT